jgi:hypothetical protein
MDNKLRLKIWRNSIIMRKNKTQLRYFMINQIDEKLDIKYKKYIFEEAMDENYYVLYIINKIECVSIIIDKKNKIAEIQCIGIDQTCMNENEVNIKLKITLKMLLEYKEILNINKIILSDNTFKKCNNEKIMLSAMLTLLTGDTWYGKYGFRPNEDFYITVYEENKKKMNTIKLKDIDLIKYLKMSKVDEHIINKIKEFIKENQKMLLKDYLQIFIKEYDRIYEYFYDFYLTLYDDLRLYNFDHKIFELLI